MRQITFASAAYLTKKKKTRREKFLEEMDQAIPWGDLLRLTEKHYRKVSDSGRPKMPAERMLRVYFLQQWFNLSDPGAEEALYDITSMRMFARIELGQDAAGELLCSGALPPSHSCSSAPLATIVFSDFSPKSWRKNQSTRC